MLEMRQPVEIEKDKEGILRESFIFDCIKFRNI
uniref:Macaca fascicularis brain cDNA, clone: QflA-19089 n=1 Tax=Macaca fascicularis TaxID=9541 RepID=I7GID4_MACFA|nr:unnamed protein product [Macaca fascicularis]